MDRTGRQFRVKHSALIAIASAIVLTAPAMGWAQQAPRAVSPATALDVTRPQFDTETPHYEVFGADTKAANTVVAEVGGRFVTLGDVGDAIRALPPTVQSLPFDTVYPAVLKQLIQVQAMVVRAQKRGLDKDPVVIRRIKAAADRALTNELLAREAGGAITEQMILDRYASTYANKPGPEEVHVRVILVPTEAEANTVLATLAGGADFATVARNSSRDVSAAQGGDLGFMRRDTLTPEIGAVAFALTPGQTSQHPIRTGAGWFVIRVDERRVGSPPAFAAVKEDIRNALVREDIAEIGKAALNDVTVHTFDISGKEVQSAVQNPR